MTESCVVTSDFEKLREPVTNRLQLATILSWTGVLVHAMLLLTLKFGWLNPLFNDSSHRFGPGCDFFSIYAAGAKANAGISVYGIGIILIMFPMPTLSVYPALKGKTGNQMRRACFR
jgi:hypothetical protein